jgi:hypothetical protein
MRRPKVNQNSRVEPEDQAIRSPRHSPDGYDITAAADIYSLGKLIHYMLSGGVIIPRERLDDDQYAPVFAPGGRFRALRLLLSRMITTSPNHRLSNMESVELKIDRLMKGDITSVQIPYRPDARDRLQKL